MSNISNSDYKKLSDCAERFGLGLGSTFNTGDRESYHKFAADFKKASTGIETVKLALSSVAHGLTYQFKSSALYYRAKINHAEAIIPVAVRAFGEDRIAQAIAEEDRTPEMLDLSERARYDGLATLLRRSLSKQNPG